MVVVAVGALLAAGGAFYWIKWIDQSRFSAVVRNLTSTIQMARARAISTQQQVVLLLAQEPDATTTPAEDNRIFGGGKDFRLWDRALDQANFPVPPVNVPLGYEVDEQNSTQFRFVTTGQTNSDGEAFYRIRVWMDPPEENDLETWSDANWLDTAAEADPLQMICFSSRGFAIEDVGAAPVFTSYLVRVSSPALGGDRGKSVRFVINQFGQIVWPWEE
jgi:Tfp pilus assembly protein FimT